MTAAELLAHNLRRLLEEQGLTEGDLAERLDPGGTSSRAHQASNLRRYLRCERWPPAERLDALAEALGVRPVDFFADPVDD